MTANEPGGPSPVSVCLRAGWKFGTVQGRYIFQEADGDQFVGRAAAGLNLNTTEFSCLPPHFDDTGGKFSLDSHSHFIDLLGVVLSTTEWETIVPGYLTFYPTAFRVALPYLLASLSFHKDWLKKTLFPSHPLFQQQFGPLDYWIASFLELQQQEGLSKQQEYHHMLSCMELSNI